MDPVAGPSTTRPKPARRYAFACKQCRSRKLRCDGEQPECRRCQRSRETCQYPPRAAEGALENARQRIAELEHELAVLRKGPSPLSTTRDGSTSSPAGSGATTLPFVANEESDHDDISSHVGLDEHGELTYHGPTSRFYASSIGERSPETRTRYAALRERLRRDHVPALESNAGLLHRVYAPLLETKTEAELGAPPALARRLLDFYWTWQHPLHNYVYKPCFIMDFALGGPYFSKFLLHCIFALAARHLEYGSADNAFANKGERFLDSARALLVDELAAPKPRIPTIQGLLILGGRQCAVGRSSEGWLFTGMAIRMITDLGLHLNLHHLVEFENLTPADLELRKRLYCSAYIWDKSLSISLGRPPSLSRLSPAAMDMFDHADDDAIWGPVEFPGYPATCTQNTTCFLNFCRLGQIIEMIMMPFPRAPSAETAQARLSKIEQRLLEWYAQLPADLKFDVGEEQIASQVCPPPHIASLNLLYHTLLVILWRPYMDHEVYGQHSIARCIQEAQRVHDIFVIYGRTFNWTRMTYLVSYCVYSAATIDVMLMKSTQAQTRDDAAKRLATSLKILECEAQSTPGIRRSIDIIKRQLRTWSPRSERKASNTFAMPNAPSLPVSNSHSQSGDLQPYRGALPSDVPAGTAQVSAPAVPPRSNTGHPSSNSAFAENYNQYDFFGHVVDGIGHEFADTGAGFEPDAFPWTNTGDIFDPSYLGNTYYDTYMP